MRLMQILFGEPWVRRIGWALLQFLWQGTVLAVLFAMVRAVLGRRMTARGRYILACVALTAMTAAPVMTFFLTPGMGANGGPAAQWPLPSADIWQRALSYFVAVWLAGVTVLSARLIGGWRLTLRLRSISVRPAPAEWQETLEGLVARIGVSRPVRLLISSLVEVPTVVGWLRPVVLVPVGALTGLPVEHITALLAHELAHICRHDYVVNILQSIAETVFFYHPAVWWVSEQVRNERELCCDDVAVAVSGDAITYARALAELETCRPSHARTALAASDGSLPDRIRRLVLETHTVSHTLPGPGAAWAMSLLWVVGIAVAAAHAAPAQQGKTPVAVEAAPISKAAPPTALHPALSALLYGPGPFTPVPQTAAPPQTTAPAKPEVHVSGRVVNAVTGAPVKQAQVIARNIPPPSPLKVVKTTTGKKYYYVARLHPGEEHSVTSDASGLFDIQGLEPGKYTIRAVKEGFQDPGEEQTIEIAAAKEGTVVRMTPLARIGGKVVNGDGDPVSDVTMEVYESQIHGGHREMHWQSQTLTDDLGQYHISNLLAGTYYIFASGRPGTIPLAGRSPQAAQQSYARVYYPHSLEVTGATPMVLQAGQNAQADITLTMEPGFKVKGTVRNYQSGKPIHVELQRSGQSASVNRLAVSAATGGFEIWDVVPGAYTVRATQESGLRAEKQIQVKSADLDGVQLDLQGGLTVTGIAQVPLTLKGTPARCRVVLDSANPVELTGSYDAVAGPDGKIAIEGVADGRYRVEIHTAVGYVASARSGPLDLLRGAELVVRGATPDPLEISVRDDGGGVEGTAPADEKNPTAPMAVILFPSGGQAPVVTTVKDGKFLVTDLAPGEYRAYVVSNIDEIEYRSPEAQQKMRNGQTVQVRSNERARLEMKGAGQ